MPHDDELSALAATPVILARLSENGWDSRPSGDEGWAAKEIVAHLRDCEEFRLLRCRRMRDEREPFLAAFDQEQLARDRDYAAVDMSDALASFVRLRAEVLALLSELNDTAWQGVGLHEENGRITIESHIRHAISHDLVHLRQIAESLTPPLR